MLQIWPRVSRVHEEHRAESSLSRSTFGVEDLSMISWASRIFYTAAELIDAFVLVSDKFNNSLAYRRSWRHYLKGSAPVQGTLWVHGASVGELEDLAAFFLNEESLKDAGFSFDRLIVTSSSVSAKNRLLRWGQKYGLCYAGPIPPESRGNCLEFLERLNPKLMLLSHNDVWPTLFECARQRPSLKLVWLPASTKPLGFIRKRFMDPLLVLVGKRRTQDHFETTVPQVFIGNPRIDRILHRIQLEEKNTEHVLLGDQSEPQKNRLNVIVGSAWREDAHFLRQALDLLPPEVRDQVHVVVVPHDPQNAHEVALTKQWLPEAKFVLREGILVEAYKNFDFAFVGGGFRTGLHSILEPALWGLPVVCGPKISKQPEAETMIEAGQLFRVHDPQALRECFFKFLESESFRGELKAKVESGRRLLLDAQGANKRLSAALRSL